MYCGKCGSKLDENSSFCPYCGNKLKETDKENKEDDNDIEIIDININSEEEKPILMNNDIVNNNKESLNNNLNSSQNVNINSNINQNYNNYDNLNIASIILGIIGIILLLFPCSISSIIIGKDYKKKTKKVCVGQILGIIGIVIQISIIVLIIVAVCLLDKSDFKEVLPNMNDNYEIKDSYVGDDDNFQVIGNDFFGYLTLSKDWTLYKESDGTSTLQYQYKNTASILSIFAIKNPGYSLDEYAKSINVKMQSYGTNNINVENVQIDKYTAIKQTAYLTTLSSYMTTWCFSDEYGNLHYIAINSNNPDENNDIINTYVLKK